MIFKIILFFIGILLCSISFSFMLIYMNLLNMGYSFYDYVNFIIRRGEILCIIPGIILLIILMHKRKGNKNDVCL